MGKEMAFVDSQDRQQRVTFKESIHERLPIEQREELTRPPQGLQLKLLQGDSHIKISLDTNHTDKGRCVVIDSLFGAFGGREVGYPANLLKDFQK